MKDLVHAPTHQSLPFSSITLVGKMRGGEGIEERQRPLGDLGMPTILQEFDASSILGLAKERQIEVIFLYYFMNPRTVKYFEGKKIMTIL